MKRETVEPMPGKSYSSSCWREAPQWTDEMESELVRLANSRGPAVAKAFAQRVFGIHPKAVDRRLRRLIPDLVRRTGHAPLGDRWEEGEGERLAGLLEGTATLKSIAQRISNLNLHEPVRSAAAVRSKLWRSEREMGLPGFKATEVAEMLGVQERQVKRWTHNGYLETKAGRISEGSLEDLLKNRPHLVPFQRLDKEQQELLLCLGYRSKQGQGKRLRQAPRESGRQRLACRSPEKTSERSGLKLEMTLPGEAL